MQSVHGSSETRQERAKDARKGQQAMGQCLHCLLQRPHQREGVGPESEVVVPLWQWEGLVGRAVLFLELPVFEGEGQALAVETQDDVIELVVLRSEVVLILGH